MHSLLPLHPARRDSKPARDCSASVGETQWSGVRSPSGCPSKRREMLTRGRARSLASAQKVVLRGRMSKGRLRAPVAEAGLPGGIPSRGRAQYEEQLCSRSQNLLPVSQNAISGTDLTASSQNTALQRPWLPHFFRAPISSNIWVYLRAVNARASWRYAVEFSAQ
jgi:hypothetical protein